MAVEFQQEGAAGEEPIPEAAPGKRFASAGRSFYAADTADNILFGASLFARQIAVPHEDVRESLSPSFYSDEAMEDVCRSAIPCSGMRKQDVSFPRFAGKRRDNNRVFVAFDKRPHTNTGRGETHLFFFRD